MRSLIDEEDFKRSRGEVSWQIEFYIVVFKDILRVKGIKLYV